MRLSTIINILLIILALSFIGLLLVKRFIYFVPSYEFNSPKKNYSELNEGGISAWYLEGTNNRVILFCHGNGGNISHRQDKYEELNKLGFSILAVDYIGYGHSRGVPNEENCYKSVDVYASLLLEKYGRNNMIAYGESLGTACASYVALKYSIPFLILEGTLPSVRDLIETRYGKVLGKVLGIFFYEFRTVDYLKKYKGSVLTLHCVNDEIIPLECLDEVKNYSSEFIEMNGSHNAPIIPYDKVNSFLK